MFTIKIYQCKEGVFYMNQIKGRLSVVMPAYNEGQVIYSNLIETDKVLRNMSEDFEIIVVNDGSSDDTLNMAKHASLKLNTIKVVNSEINQGKGNALKLGVEKCTGEYIVFLDSDLDLHPSQLDKFMDIMNNSHADVVIGSKFHPQSVTDYPKRRKIISFGYYILLMVLFGLPTRDTQTGIKLFKANVIIPVMQKILVKRFAFDIEILANINRLKYKIAEAPIKLSYSRTQKWGRIGFKDIWDVFIDTLAIFYRMNILHYYDDIPNSTEDSCVDTKNITKII